MADVSERPRINWDRSKERPPSRSDVDARDRQTGRDDERHGDRRHDGDRPSGPRAYSSRDDHSHAGRRDPNSAHRSTQHDSRHGAGDRSTGGDRRPERDERGTRGGPADRHDAAGDRVAGGGRPDQEERGIRGGPRDGSDAQHDGARRELNDHGEARDGSKSAATDRREGRANEERVPRGGPPERSRGGDEPGDARVWLDRAKEREPQHGGVAERGDGRFGPRGGAPDRCNLANLEDPVDHDRDDRTRRNLRGDSNGAIAGDEAREPARFGRPAGHARDAAPDRAAAAHRGVDASARDGDAPRNNRGTDDSRGTAFRRSTDGVRGTDAQHGTDVGRSGGDWRAAPRLGDGNAGPPTRRGSLDHGRDHRGDNRGDGRLKSGDNRRRPYDGEGQQGGHGDEGGRPFERGGGGRSGGGGKYRTLTWDGEGGGSGGDFGEGGGGRGFGSRGLYGHDDRVGSRGPREPEHWEIEAAAMKEAAALKEQTMRSASANNQNNNRFGGVDARRPAWPGRGGPGRGDAAPWSGGRGDGGGRGGVLARHHSLDQRFTPYGRPSGRDTAAAFSSPMPPNGSAPARPTSAAAHPSSAPPRGRWKHDLFAEVAGDEPAAGERGVAAASTDDKHGHDSGGDGDDDPMEPGEMEAQAPAGEGAEEEEYDASVLLEGAVATLLDGEDEESEEMEEGGV